MDHDINSLCKDMKDSLHFDEIEEYNILKNECECTVVCIETSVKRYRRYLLGIDDWDGLEYIKENILKVLQESCNTMFEKELVVLIKQIDYALLNEINSS